MSERDEMRKSCGHMMKGLESQGKEFELVHWSWDGERELDLGDFFFQVE